MKKPNHTNLIYDIYFIFSSLCTIHKALDKRDGEIVQLKVITMEDNTKYDNIHIQSFQHIIDLCKTRTKTSLFLVKFKGLWLENNQIWIASEFCGGGSISNIIKITKQPLKEYQICVIIKEVLKGLEYLHKYKSIHRQIRAEHIYIDQKGQCKISKLIQKISIHLSIFTLSLFTKCTVIKHHFFFYFKR